MTILINLLLLLRKSVYPYEYMDSWERFYEKTLPKTHYIAQKVWGVFQIKNLGEYHDLYVSSNVMRSLGQFQTFYFS